MKRRELQHGGDFAARAVDLTQRAGRGEIGMLRIGFFNGGTGTLVPKLIRDFRRKHPGVRVTVSDMLPSQQSKALAEGDLDIGFTRPPDPSFAHQLRTELLYSDPLVAVLPRNHRLARGVVDLRSLADEKFVLVARETPSALFDKVISACSKAGFSPQIVNTAAVWSSVALLVEAGEGVAILPSNLQQRGTGELAFCPLRPPGESIELVLAWSPAREGPLQTAFLELAREARRRIAAR